MKGIEQFEAKGWKIYYRLKDVIAISPNGKQYPICGKYFGGTDYDDEIKLAYEAAIIRNLIT